MMQTRSYTKDQKPQHGKLALRIPGKPDKVLEKDKTFPILQNLKKQYVAEGYSADHLKVTY